MATTDARTGFRLPWGSDRGESEQGVEGATDATTAQDGPSAQESETAEMIDAVPAASEPTAAGEAALVGPPAAETTAAPSAPEPSDVGRKPNKFLADLTRAMQAAAESAREETLARFAADAKQHIETIHTDSAAEATELRKRADDDVAAVREWSKAEIARIREETDERINARKGRLEREIEEHAAEIEARIERVQARVAAFEAEMAAFFERLLAEDDPTRFAAMAESLPEPPPFDRIDTGSAWATPAPDPVPAASQATESTEAAEADAPAAAEATTDTDGPATASLEASAVHDHADGETSQSEPGDLAGTGTEEAATADETVPGAEADPRLAAIGAEADFAAAEAEAAAFTPDEGAPADGASAEEVPVIADEALAARLAGLVPEADAPAGEATTTRVVVVGLVSVASIAGFKRHLSRVAGVQTVGVSSGPDGEFVFNVTHGSDLSLRDAVTTLPGFAARVTAEAAGELSVTARDPETEG
jgi:hypothetical protein